LASSILHGKNEHHTHTVHANRRQQMRQTYANRRQQTRQTYLYSGQTCEFLCRIAYISGGRALAAKMNFVVLVLFAASIATIGMTSAQESVNVPRRCLAGFELVNTTCRPCAPGMFNAFSGMQCIGCANGFFSNSSNSTTCIHCGPNERSILPRDNENTCHCNVGFGGVTLSIYDDRDYCVACDIGFFSTGALPLDRPPPQRDMCYECPHGMTTNRTHSTLASDCVTVAVATTPALPVEILASTTPVALAVT